MLKAINQILFLKNLIFSLVMFLISYQFRLIIFYKFDVNVFTDISNPMSGIYYYIISLIGFRLKSILKLFDFNLDINKIRLFLNILNKNKIYMGGSEPDSIDKNLYLKKSSAGSNSPVNYNNNNNSPSYSNIAKDEDISDLDLNEPLNYCTKWSNNLSFHKKSEQASNFPTSEKNEYK